MRELDCDFCGAAAAGTYEVGPAPPDRSPSDRRRLVLCADCRATLADAIQPLLDRLAAAEDDGTVETGVTVESGTSAGGDTAVGSGTRDGGDTAAGSDTGDGGDTAAGGDGRDDGTDPLGGGREGAGGTVSGPGSSDGGTTTDEAAATDGATPETGEAATATDEAGRASESGGDEHGGTDDPAPTTDSTPAGAGTTDGADAGGSEPPGEEPPEFRKVVRLLNNRSFPVEREEFVELAASAYGLEESAVGESLAYAVDRGVLAVEDGQIVRG